MSISTTTSLGSKPDSAYNLKHLGPSKTPLKPKTLSHPIDDTVSISDEALALLEDEEEKKKFFGINDYSQAELDAMLEQLKSSKDDSNSPMKIQLQCFQIAMRIISGDNVPTKDRAFLAEHEPEMLGRAMLLRRQKDSPKDHKSVLEDDEVEPFSSDILVSTSISQGTTAEVATTDNVEVSVDLEA